MNLSLHDPFTLAQDSPETLVNDLREWEYAPDDLRDETKGGWKLIVIGSGHATTLRFNRKGDYLASGRVDGKIIIWDCETWGVAMKLVGHWKQIQSLSWSRDGHYLLSASQDCTAILWDLSTQTRLRTIKFQAPIYLAELHPRNHNLFVVSLFEDHPYLVDTTQPKPTKHLLPTTPLDLSPTKDKQQTTASIFSSDGTFIIAGTSKGFINLIETANLKIIHSTKLSSGLISLLRLTSNGRQMLVNSTDRIIRVVDMPDLSQIRPSTAPAPDPTKQQQQNGDEDETPSLQDPSTIHLHTSHKFQDLVNRLRWNDCAFSHTSATTLSTLSSITPISKTSADYVVASTYMKRDIYIWELASNSLLRILENAQEPAIIEWHPSKPLLACTGFENGSISIWGIEPQQKWSALAPDFMEVTENVEYQEREDEFDTYPAGEFERRRLEGEDETVDVLTLDDTNPNPLSDPTISNSNQASEDQSFVLPILLNIDDSEDDDLELLRVGPGGYREKGARDFEEDGFMGGGAGTPVGSTAGGNVGTTAKKRRR